MPSDVNRYDGIGRFEGIHLQLPVQRARSQSMYKQQGISAQAYTFWAGEFVVKLVVKIDIVDAECGHINVSFGECAPAHHIQYLRYFLLAVVLRAAMVCSGILIVTLPIAQALDDTAAVRVFAVPLADPEGQR